ncbi:MAG: bifunctional acetate--CoA ligase family protein/GNAT family N-acetyltransferase [Acidimicrobiales bacterium]
MVTEGDDEVRPPGYPEQWEADVVLSDGATVHLRPIRTDDGRRIVEFHNRQSPESIYYRFFSAKPRLSDRDVERFTTVDYVNRMAFVAILGDDLIGVARYDRPPEASDAEVAFFTDDRHHGRGLATIMLEYLAAVAREHGIDTFNAQTLPQNRKMLGVFKAAGFAVSTRFDDGVIEVRLGIEPTLEAQAAIDERERRAEARSMTRLFSPRSVAVIGAGRSRGGLGHETVRNLVAGGFEGPVYPVNATASHVASIPAHASVSDIPGEVDLAVVAVPASEVPAVVAECADKGVQGLVIISAGFAETGSEGAAAQRQIVELARRHGMRLVGPNCMGIINTAPAVGLRATFAPVQPSPGNVAFLSQSGTLGTAILEAMEDLGLQVSTFASLGNKADVSANDLLQFWEQDERTDAVLLYMESFGNLRKFSRIARRVGRVKPVIAVTSGGASLGGAEVDLPGDATLDALLRQAGVIRVSTLDLLFDVTRLLIHQPVPSGSRVAIVSNSSGPARLAVDACRGAGLTGAVLSAETEEAIALSVPMASHTANPLDLTFQADAGHFEAALRHVLADDGVDSVIAIYAPPLEARTDDALRAIDAAAGGAKPVVATVLGASPRRRLVPGELSVPVFGFPEEAARALGRVTRYGSWLADPEGEVVELTDADPERAAEMARSLLDGRHDGRSLDHLESSALVRTMGIELVEERQVGTVDEAVEAAASIGHPVVLKATGLDRLAKTESGGVAVDLHGEFEVRQSYERMTALLGDAMRPALVQEMVPAGVDVAISVVQADSVGSVISIGFGGVVLDQVGFDSMRFMPLTDIDAERLVDASRLAPLLVAGSQERAHLVGLLVRVAALADAVPEMAELLLNPVVVSPAAAAVTDARVRLSPWDGDVPVRRLSED